MQQLEKLLTDIQMYVYLCTVCTFKTSLCYMSCMCYWIC